MLSPSQDFVFFFTKLVLSSGYRSQIFSVAAGIIVDYDVMTSTKYWTIIRDPVNCV